MKKTNHPRAKSRIFAVLCAALVLVPALMLCVGAYPAEQYLPANDVLAFGGSALPSYYTAPFAVDEFPAQNTDEVFAVTYADVRYSFADNTIPWKYASFQIDVLIDGNSYGHYTCGIYQEQAGAIMVRLGRTELVPAYPSVYPSLRVLPAETESICFGQAVTKDTNGNAHVRMEYIAFDGNGNVLDAFVFSETCPIRPEQFVFSGKTEYARVTNASMLDTTTTIPHMPYDLVGYDVIGSLGYDDGYNNGYAVGDTDGYADGYHNAAVDQANSFDNFGRLMWTIVDMPFNLIAQIFDFEIFGLNIASTVMGILSIALVVFVLHKVGVL